MAIVRRSTQSNDRIAMSFQHISLFPGANNHIFRIFGRVRCSLLYNVAGGLPGIKTYILLRRFSRLLNCSASWNGAFFFFGFTGIHA